MTQKDLFEWHIDKAIREWDCMYKRDVMKVYEKINADTRNKLTPIKNLCAMIENLPSHIKNDVMFHDSIFKEIKQVRKSINYLMK